MKTDLRGSRRRLRCGTRMANSQLCYTGRDAKDLILDIRRRILGEVFRGWPSYPHFLTWIQS